MSRTAALLFLLASLTACDASHDAVEVQVSRYIGPTITESDALAPDITGPRGWEALVFHGRRSTNTLLLQETLCGDECSLMLSVDFRDLESDRLPTFLSATLRRQELSPERDTTIALDVDRVEIQDWGPDVYSGHVILREDPPDIVSAPIVFWADEPSISAE